MGPLQTLVPSIFKHLLPIHSGIQQNSFKTIIDIYYCYAKSGSALVSEKLSVCVGGDRKYPER